MRVFWRLRSVALLTALAVHAAAAVPASHAAGRSFTYSGRECEEAVVLHTVPVEAVQDDLSDGIEAQQVVPGRALLVVTALSCASLDVDGRRQAPGILSEVGVSIHAPEGEDPNRQHFYLLWQLTNHRALREAMRRVSVEGELVPHATYSSSADRAWASLPWTRGGYEVTVTAPSPIVASKDDENSWWHRGSEGMVEVRYGLAGVRVSSGAGSYTAATGSPLADSAPVIPSAGFRIGFASITGEVSVTPGRTEGHAPAGATHPRPL